MNILKSTFVFVCVRVCVCVCVQGQQNQSGWSDLARSLSQEASNILVVVNNCNVGTTHSTVRI